jgi:CheY-like chemotaxis protein
MLKAGPAATRAILVLQTSASYVEQRPTRVRALEGGADNYLFEPIEPEELVANVKPPCCAWGGSNGELRESRAPEGRIPRHAGARTAQPARAPSAAPSTCCCKLEPNDPPELQEQRAPDHPASYRSPGAPGRRPARRRRASTHGKITLHHEQVELNTFIKSRA